VAPSPVAAPLVAALQPPPFPYPSPCAQQPPSHASSSAAEEAHTLSLVEEVFNEYSRSGECTSGQLSVAFPLVQEVVKGTQEKKVEWQRVCTNCKNSFTDSRGTPIPHTWTQCFLLGGNYDDNHTAAAKALRKIGLFNPRLPVHMREMVPAERRSFLEAPQSIPLGV
jgi:hypothetical protein